MKRKTVGPVWTLREANKFIDNKVAYSTFWRWAREGRLPTCTIGKKTFVLREKFMKMFEQSTPHE